MKKILLPSFLLLSAMGFSQSLVQAYKNRATQVTQTNINTLLTDFTSYGVKTTGSTANNNAFAWLKSKYVAFGYDAAQITENAFTYNSKQTKNLIVTKTGTVYPNKYLIVCGHYDTITGPGTNDNGSGISIILEAARILQNVSSEYSIKFINFSGEEQGLYGSQAYVTNVVKATNPKMDIILVLNLDEVGGVAGMTNNKVIAEKDGTPTYPTNGTYSTYPSSNNAASTIKTTELKNSMLNYSNITPVDGYIERSDYMPFEKEGYVVTGLYEFNESNKPHTANDTYVNMDPVYVYNIAQGIVGAIQHFSTADTSITLSANAVSKNLSDRVSLFPNPANNFLNIGLDGKGFTTTIVDMSGKTIMQSKDQQDLDTSKLINGIYLVKITMGNETTTKKLIIKK
ncbi:M28 family peptidase [Kaistella jeonii]|uniref:Leucyl aminopeptidase n=1 Tax=Kaistella jeonii TaxID=266749 RepID=A0A0C1FSA5_9FLAO|nr:M28 family peptidase [Kaistella jeonii]KIA90804.1 leucyl aminopeptidase [Kaistella jeonii]SFB68531.1 aminopeptidase YwaD [Kaistella jeonii]VEI94648.1 Arginyl aminopeptidase [Kaistella jeonii]